jgi:hypothetical protein
MFPVLSRGFLSRNKAKFVVLFISFNLASDEPMTTLLSMLGASICFLFAVAGDVILLGTPTGSINLGSH